MAVASLSSSSGQIVTAEPKFEQPSQENLPVSSSLPNSDPRDPSNPLLPSSSSSATITSSSPSFSIPSAPSPMATGSLPPAAPAPPIPSFPSFRPVPSIPVGAPQFSPIPSSSIQPPGVSPVVPSATLPLVRYPVMLQPYAQMQNGYPAAPVPLPVPSMPAGIVRYPPYASAVRPPFQLYPPGAMGMIPQLSRPPMLAIRGISPIVGPGARPVIPIVPVAEKPQTTVYVGKIATSVENDFLLSLLRLCGPVKSWKRAQDPSTGAPKGYGFCEFEAAEGVLRALRLLSKLSVDGQELMLNVSQATRDYLERYVEKKIERQRVFKEESSENPKKEEAAPGVDALEASIPTAADELKEKDGSSDKPDVAAAKRFGIVTEEDREGDRDALEKLTSMLEERAKNRPPPPPSIRAPFDASGKSNSEVPSKSRDWDSDVDIIKSDAAEDQNDDETTSEQKHSTDHERPETSSSDRGRKDKRNKEGDHEHGLKREERELERYERERDRERVRRDREREHKLREAERLYKDRVKEWESREREKDYQKLHEKEREKERERERRREIKEQEDESDDDDSRKRRGRGSTYEEGRRKRQREKEDDMMDRSREEEEVAEANRRAIEDQKKKDEHRISSSELPNGNAKFMKSIEEGRDRDESYEADHGDVHNGDSRSDSVMSIDEPNVASIIASDMQQTSNVPTWKLGFGLVGSKRAAVSSVFQAEDDEDGEKEKKMRPLVPIDYSTEELQAVQPAASGPSANLAAAAEFAKRISGNNAKEEKSQPEKERSRRASDRSGQREKEHLDDEIKERTRDKGHDKDRNRVIDKKTTENKKLLDAKQLIDMIPKTKEELFSYNINWAIYDKHELHERMRPWLSKKITEFLGEEEATLVDYIVSSTKEHVKASQMLELLQSILDEEAEMFVLKMWRMLIFEIKKVETGLSLKPKA